MNAGFKAATNDEAEVRRWWTKWPDANVGLATGPSGLTVLDIDGGIESSADFEAWRLSMGLPVTYTVRTGRRHGLGLQMYFAGGGLPSVPWASGVVHGDIRSATGYVMAEGSLHPSGAFYTAHDEAAIAEEPAFVRGLERPKLPPVAPGQKMQKIPEGGGRHDALARVAGSFRAMGFDADGIYEQLVAANTTMMEVPVDDADLREMAEGFERRYPAGSVEPEVVIGKTKEPKAEGPPPDWRTFYHGFDEMENAPEMTFLIENFMHVESITGLAAAVGQRKSLIALNIAHSLCTGEPFMGKFAVIEQPKKVLYLCPEMGMRSFRKRVRAIGLMPHVGKNFFCRTMNREDHRDLDDLTPDELDGSVVILDTAIRFIEGNENSAEDMKEFAAKVFRLVPHEGKPGAAAVVILYHSGKGGKETTELTMENVLRGSGELGAALTCCWATRLQEPDKKFESLSYVTCVKPRDFDTEPEPFEADCDSTCRMRFVESAGRPVLMTRVGNVANKDGNDPAAFAMIAANSELSGVKMAMLLKDHGIKRSADWVNKYKAANGIGNGVKKKAE